jgi:hypothetical protein
MALPHTSTHRRTEELQPEPRHADPFTMLVCKACNTRFGTKMGACPNCGRRAAEHAVEEGVNPLTPSEASPLPLAAVMPDDDETHADVAVELGEEVVVPKPKPASPAVKKSSAPAPRPPEPGPTVFHLNPSQVRTLIAEQPDLLERGLAIYADEDGQPMGANFPTPVGEIHLVARDAKGNFVVILVPDPGDATKSVADVLQRMGWVRKHLVRDNKEVRGFVLLDQLPEEVAYAAAGVAGAVTFKTFRVALTFHDLDI